MIVCSFSSNATLLRILILSLLQFVTLNSVQSELLAADSDTTANNS
jgi:hypothetical protein